jgi:hypothetical protein
MSVNLIVAQNSNYDKIVKKDYDIIEVNITKISNSEVSFNFPNETLTNVLDLSEVAKIIFKSGRIQNFNIESKKAQSVSIDAPAAVESQIVIVKQTLKENTIAILPVPFVNTNTLVSSAEMAKFAQNDLYSKLIQASSNIFPLTIQDIRITNSLLKKAGIDYSNIDEVLIEDLEAVLGVDHIIASKVSYVMTTSQTNSVSSNTSIRENGNNRTSVDDFSSSRNSEDFKFDYNVYLDMYKNKTKIYTKYRKPIFEFRDSWMDSMIYQIECTRISKKGKL